MPIYEYKCADCENRIEKMQKVSDPPLAVCEKCGGKLEKQWSLSGFQFKGAGWYVTDYSAKGKPDAKTDSKPDGVSSDSKGESKSEAAATGKKSSAGESTTKSDAASKSVEKTDSKKE